MDAQSSAGMNRSQPDSSSNQTQFGKSSGFFSGLRIVSLCTMLSRVLGLIRDVSMASLFGNGAVMDAFSVAFRIPNLSRRLFGEGALTTAFLPIFIREIERGDSTNAWKLASAVLTLMTYVLCVVVILGELLLWGASAMWETSAEAELLIGLTATMLPYLVLICLAAQVSAVMHALNHFTWPALLPMLLNVVWIATIWLVACWWETSTEQVYVIAAGVLVGGLLQLLAPLPTLFRLGFHYDQDWRSAVPQVVEVGKCMVPILIGLSVTQMNTIADSLIAWGFSPSAGGVTRMNLPGSPEFPVEAGTASALYFAQRMYQFPLGVFGVALGTVLFPLLSRHAERGDLDKVRQDLSLGLRLVLCVGLPASAGLVLLARPLTELIFQHGAFDLEDTEQTVGMIAAYGVGVWAYIGLLIVHRGYYAVGERQTPMYLGMVAVVINLVLNLTLIWFLGGEGLAISTAVTAILQVILVTIILQSRIGKLELQAFRHTLVRAVAATGIMSLVCYLVLDLIGPGESFPARLMRVLIPFTVSVLTYFAVAKLLGMREIWLLFKREGRNSPSDD